MQTAPTHPDTPGVPAARLRSSFAWTFAGNAVYGAGQWAILSLLAKLGGSEMLGQYAFAVAISTPIAMLSHLNLRAVLATDMEARHPFGDYLAVRLFCTGLGLAALAAAAAVSAQTWKMALATFLTGAALNMENVSDLYYGALQRRDRMKEIARSMMARAIVSILFLALALAITHDLLAVTSALLTGRLVVLLAYDRPRGSRQEDLGRSGASRQWTILRTALPLGVVLMLVALTASLPRYSIERWLGVRELGAFAAAASFLTVGSTVVNALGQAATPRLARAFADRDRRRIRQLSWQLAGIALLLGAAGVLAAAIAGRPVLRILYRRDFETYGGLLVGVMCAATLSYVAGMVGYVITSARAFQSQMPLFCLSALTSAGGSWLLVPRLGLSGAVVALALAATVQLAGEIWILGRTVRHLEPSR